MTLSRVYIRADHEVAAYVMPKPPDGLARVRDLLRREWGTWKPMPVVSRQSFMKVGVVVKMRYLGEGDLKNTIFEAVITEVGEYEVSLVWEDLENLRNVAFRVLMLDHKCRALTKKSKSNTWYTKVSKNGPTRGMHVAEKDENGDYKRLPTANRQC